MEFNLSSLTIILLSENHLMAFLDSAVSISNNILTDLANDDRILSSAKLSADTFLMQKKKKSSKYALKKTSPTIEPFATPEIMSLKPQRHMDRVIFA